MWPWKETVETYLDSHGVIQPREYGTFRQLTEALAAHATILLGIIKFWPSTASRKAPILHIVKKQNSHAALRTDRPDRWAGRRRPLYFWKSSVGG